MDELITIVKSSTYKVGECSITDKVGKERKLRFDNGETIEVTPDEFEYIHRFGWCERIEEE